MYLEHFGLRETPFAITPGTAFVYASRAHQEALNTLLIAIDGGEGFVKITGEVGTGKTMLCRRFLDLMRERGLSTAYIPNPALRPRTLLLAIARELGLRVSATLEEFDLMRRLNNKLLRVADEGGSVVVCLDEAQALPLQTLEALRLLSNLETEKRKLLQVVLFGQPELDRTLARHEVRQLRQRIGFDYTMGGLSERETDRYVAHRVAVAGYAGPELFSPQAVRSLYRASRGVPRLINILSHKAMLCAYGDGARQVSARHVSAAIADTGSVLQNAWWRAPLNWLAQHRQGVGA